MSLIVQLRCIICNLCIKSTQVLASRIVCRHIIQFLASFCNRCVVVVQRLARYQLVGSRSICSSSGRAFRERICAKSLAPGSFAGLLCCCFLTGIFNRGIFSIKLNITIFVYLVNFDVTTYTRSILKLLHNNSIMIFDAVSSLNETIVVSRIIICLLNIKIVVINNSTIRITFSIGALFPDYFIPGYVAFIMAERYGLGSVCCSLISDCRCKIIEYLPIHLDPGCQLLPLPQFFTLFVSHISSTKPSSSNNRLVLAYK